MQEKEKRGGLKSIELCRMLAKGRTKADKSLAFAKKAGRVLGNIHPIQ